MGCSTRIQRATGRGETTCSSTYIIVADLGGRFAAAKTASKARGNLLHLARTGLWKMSRERGRRLNNGKSRNTLALMALVLTGATVLAAQSTGRDQLARGHAAWDQRLSKTAIAAFEAAAGERPTAAEAHEALGRIYLFKGWQQEGTFPGWHDEPAYRSRAIAELKAALAVEPARASAQEALRMAEAFAAADHVESAPPRAEVKALDAKLDSYRAAATAAVPDIVAAIAARTKAQADPAPYFIGAQMLIDRGDYDRAIALVGRGVEAADRFIQENLSAYQMDGKSQGSLMRSRAQAADLAGWAMFMKGDTGGAASKLEESERLYRGQDFNNQFHLGEVARARNQPDGARDAYLNALSLAAGPAPVRQRVTDALRAMYASSQTSAPLPFDAWLEQELARRQSNRRNAGLKSLLDRRLPALRLTTVDGRPYDTASLQGKVLLLNFFASW
jgi:tetratricopeptide (TPR) repeat protein